MLAVTTVLTLVGFPETKWNRRTRHNNVAAAGQEDKVPRKVVEADHGSNGASHHEAYPDGKEASGSNEPTDPYLGKGKKITRIAQPIRAVVSLSVGQS